jgi:hypothetical protein
MCKEILYQYENVFVLKSRIDDDTAVYSLNFNMDLTTKTAEDNNSILNNCNDFKKPPFVKLLLR